MPVAWPTSNQVAIRVANVRPDLASMVLRLSEKLRALGRPFLVDLVDVRDADVEEGARAARVGRRRERDGGLVVCGTGADRPGTPNRVTRGQVATCLPCCWGSRRVGAARH